MPLDDPGMLRSRLHYGGGASAETGIDPGTACTGYGVVKGDGLGLVSLVECGVIRTRAREPLALRLTDEGRQRLHSPPAADASLEGRIGKLAHSELRALERGFEILERLPR